MQCFLLTFIPMTLKTKSALEILKAIRADAKRKGIHKLSMREINREIAAARRERRSSKAQ
jgi:hypothetical protein